jgi:hypothetical protein
MVAKAVNPVGIYMVPVKAEFGADINHHQDTAGHANGKTGNINK